MSKDGMQPVPRQSSAREWIIDNNGLADDLTTSSRALCRRTCSQISMKYSPTDVTLYEYKEEVEHQSMGMASQAAVGGAVGGSVSGAASDLHFSHTPRAPRYESSNPRNNVGKGAYQYSSGRASRKKHNTITLERTGDDLFVSDLRGDFLRRSNRTPLPRKIRTRVPFTVSYDRLQGSYYKITEGLLEGEILENLKVRDDSSDSDSEHAAQNSNISDDFSSQAPGVLSVLVQTDDTPTHITSLSPNAEKPVMSEELAGSCDAAPVEDRPSMTDAHVTPEAMPDASMRDAERGSLPPTSNPNRDDKAAPRVSVDTDGDGSMEPAVQAPLGDFDSFENNPAFLSVSSNDDAPAATDRSLNKPPADCMPSVGSRFPEAINESMNEPSALSVLSLEVTDPVANDESTSEPPGLPLCSVADTVPCDTVNESPAPSTNVLPDDNMSQASDDNAESAVITSASDDPGSCDESKTPNSMSAAEDDDHISGVTFADHHDESINSSSMSFVNREDASSKADHDTRVSTDEIVPAPSNHDSMESGNTVHPDTKRVEHVRQTADSVNLMSVRSDSGLRRNSEQIVIHQTPKLRNEIMSSGPFTNYTVISSEDANRKGSGDDDISQMKLLNIRASDADDAGFSTKKQNILVENDSTDTRSAQILDDGETISQSNEWVANNNNSTEDSSDISPNSLPLLTGDPSVEAEDGSSTPVLVEEEAVSQLDQSVASNNNFTEDGSDISPNSLPSLPGEPSGEAEDGSSTPVLVEEEAVSQLDQSVTNNNNFTEDGSDMSPNSLRSLPGESSGEAEDGSSTPVLDDGETGSQSDESVASNNNFTEVSSDIPPNSLRSLPGESSGEAEDGSSTPVLVEEEAVSQLDQSVTNNNNFTEDGSDMSPNSLRSLPGESSGEAEDGSSTPVLVEEEAVSQLCLLVPSNNNFTEGGSNMSPNSPRSQPGELSGEAEDGSSTPDAAGTSSNLRGTPDGSFSLGNLEDVSCQMDSMDSHTDPQTAEAIPEQNLDWKEEINKLPDTFYRANGQLNR